MQVSYSAVRALLAIMEVNGKGKCPGDGDNKVSKDTV